MFLPEGDSYIWECECGELYKFWGWKHEKTAVYKYTSTSANFVRTFVFSGRDLTLFRCRCGRRWVPEVPVSPWAR